MRIDDKVCLTTYFNTINIENNMRICGRSGNKRDDPRLFKGRKNKKEDTKRARRQEERGNLDGSVLNAIKDLKIPLSRDDIGLTIHRSPFQGNFNKKNRLQTFPIIQIGRMENL